MIKVLASAAALMMVAAGQPAAAQTQAEMNARAGADLRRADHALNAQWKQTYALMKERDAEDGRRGGGLGYAAATLASQRAWLQFRDKQCVIEGGEVAGGSMQPMVRGQCLARLTRERTKQLKDLMWTR
ncbi:lysozyme inhibitor LprI family protein [Sphingomonas jeddahensis]|uniref:Lysozyme inhibitor LprI-like N-terminal domain-containing protein n=1 Tax=Sphingomonas jeddahensis TaxID=1915074 RepID=A0A1V2EWC1_9SPHN|nr:lysozyme inhibitor LprI family protein [Sphingomonas jeddahensis]ONF96469.1 hypothetical protein SPHI_12540 [Sphingomonas jeddahensis]